MTKHLTIVDHPLVQHKLTLMRERETGSAVFRQLLHEITQLLAYEITREMPMTTKPIETPMQASNCAASVVTSIGTPVANNLAWRQ